MFNKTNSVPVTLNEQYNADYFSKTEYITRLSIDLVMSDLTLDVCMPDHIKAPAGQDGFTYNLMDLIEETSHIDECIGAMVKLSTYSDIEKTRTDYNEFLIEYAGERIERWIDDGYEIELK